MDEALLEHLFTIVTNQILNRSGRLYGHEKEEAHVSGLLKRAVDLGESNSALIIGPRGCGKTTLVNTLLHQMEKSLEQNGLVVHLHGLVHTDDRLALKAITSQLKLEGKMEGKLFDSFAENLSFLLESLKSTDRSRAKSVVFLLDDFDLFCGHRNQTLLYNLLDTAQSSQAPVFVLGLTARLDVIELLEKRVKSRFSHRQIFLRPQWEALSLTSELVKVPQTLGKSFAMTWNNAMQSLLGDEMVQEVLTNMRHLQSDQRRFRYWLLAVLSLVKVEVTSNASLPKPSDFLNAAQAMALDPVVSLLSGLSILELCLVIAMKHHSTIYDNEPFNFKMIHQRYTKYSIANGSVDPVQHPVVMKAFEHLLSLEFLAPVDANPDPRLKEYQLYRLLLASDQIAQAVRHYKGLPTSVEQWASSSLQ